MLLPDPASSTLDSNVSLPPLLGPHYTLRRTRRHISDTIAASGSALFTYTCEYDCDGATVPGDLPASFTVEAVLTPAAGSASPLSSAAQVTWTLPVVTYTNRCASAADSEDGLAGTDCALGTFCYDVGGSIEYTAPTTDSCSSLPQTMCTISDSCSVANGDFDAPMMILTFSPQVRCCGFSCFELA